MFLLSLGKSSRIMKDIELKLTSNALFDLPSTTATLTRRSDTFGCNTSYRKARVSGIDMFSFIGRINNTTLRRIKRNSLYESSQSKEDPSTSTEAPQVKSMVNIGSEKCCLIEENLERIIDGTTATTTKIG